MDPDDNTDHVTVPTEGVNMKYNNHITSFDKGMNTPSVSQDMLKEHSYLPLRLYLLVLICSLNVFCSLT